MERGFKIFILISLFSFVLCQNDMENAVDHDPNDLMVTKSDILEPPSFVNWPKGVVPFYINPDHFDSEQTLIIMTSLTHVAFKTCIKFDPAMVAPQDDEHVLTFQNPTGVRKCEIPLAGHPKDQPHVVYLGYDCLQAPWMDRIVMRALGLPFEHDRQGRDNYIDVQYENIEQHAIPLYTKDINLPAALRALPYDINSVLHFGERDFSKNGHRTIIFKDREVKQTWDGLSELDLRKIEIIYGPECRERDRQEKIELCHMYPGIPSVDRKKRSVDVEPPKSLRVNPDITPPADNGLNISKDVQAILVKLNIVEEVSKIVEDVFRVSSKALSNTRAKFCNITKESLRTQVEGKTDVLGIIQLVAEYAQTMVDTAAENMTSFCAKSDSVDKYQRFRCADGCERNYYSTKNSLPFRSTKHAPYIPQSTKHVGGPHKPPYDRPFFNYYNRAQNDSSAENTNKTVTEKQRKKRQVLRYTKAVSIVELERARRGAYTEGLREGRRKRRRALEEKHRAQSSLESDYILGSDERVKRKRKGPVSDESENEYRDEYSVKKKKPNRGGKRVTRRPVIQDSDYENEDRGGKRITKRPLIQDSEENRQDSDSIEDEINEPESDDSGSNNYNNKRKRPVQQEQDPENGKVYKEDAKIHKSEQGGIKKRLPGILPEENEPEDDEQGIKKRLPGILPEDNELKDDEQGIKKKLLGILPEENEPEDDEQGIKKLPGILPEENEPEDDEQSPKAVVLSKLNQEFYKQRRWPHGVVLYLIDKNCTKFDIQDLRRRLKQVNGILRRRTCARLQEIRPGEVNKFDDYLVLDNSPDYVTGRVGGRQVFGVPELLAGGQHRQHTAMVVMAMLGFYFELSRHDRDEYVKVHTRHIRADKLHHFEKVGSDATFPLPYDFESATHPAWMYWRKLGKKGISTVATFKDKDPDGKIMKSFGQHKKLLSESDIIKINSVYGLKCMNKESAKIESEINNPRSDWE